MPLHVPKRVYTASALEAWFSRLSGDWESVFDDHALAMGRELYQGGQVSSIELQPQHAIIHGKVDQKDIYALLEWEGDDDPQVRTSSAQKLSGYALTVAGLYEAEELLMDGISQLPPETAEEKAVAKAKRSGGGLFADSSKPKSGGLFAPSKSGRFAPPSGGGILRGSTPAAPKAQKAAESRSILVKFDASNKGLVFDAFWKNLDGSTEPAMKYYGSNSSHVNETERERLIRLTALARKNNFELEGKKHDYLLEDIEQIPTMIRDEIDVWKKYFHVELTETAGLLGKGVQVITVEVDAKEVDGMLEFSWMFLLGGKQLDETQMRAVLNAGREPVLLPQLGLLRLSSEQADVLADWKDIILSSSGRLPKYMLFSLFRQDALPIRLGKALEEWSRSLMDEAVAPAEGKLADFLRDYQRKGVLWLNHMIDHGCNPLLADEMGLGKTIQMLSLLDLRMQQGESDAPSIIVAPASVVPVWAGEVAKRFAKYRVEVVSQDNPVRSTAELNKLRKTKSKKKVLWLASYGQVKRQSEALEKVEFDYAVLDEAQMIKNPQTKAAKACYSLNAKHRLAMTGTPVENRPMDLWSVFRFLMPGLLGGLTQFERLSNEDAPKLIERLHQQIAPFILRRTKAEVAKELPEKIEEVLYAPMSTIQREQYKRLTDQGLKRFGNDLRKASRERGLAFFTLLTRLRQASCDAGLLPWVNCGNEDGGKIQTLLERMESIIASGSKVVIFSQFVGFLKRIEAAVDAKFPNLARYILTGATVDRQKPVGDFQNHKGSAVMFVSLRAGGTGITLHAADYLFLMDPWWNPAVEDQAIDRVHRLGQKRTVFVYRIVSEGTVEARIQDLKAQKKELFANLVGSIRDNTHFALYFKNMQELISLGDSEDLASEVGE